MPPLASWAIRYAASLDGVKMVLRYVSLEQMEDNLSYMKNFVPSPKAEYETVGKVVGIINSSIAIPCTACQYCVKDCPKQFPFPPILPCITQKSRITSTLGSHRGLLCQPGLPRQRNQRLHQMRKMRISLSSASAHPELLQDVARG